MKLVKMTLMTSSRSIFKFSQVFFKNNILKHFTQDHSTNRILLRVLVFAGPSDPVVCQISRLQLTEYSTNIQTNMFSDVLSISFGCFTHFNCL